MEKENVYRQEMIEKYRAAMGNLFRYIPWFEDRVGERAVQNYSGADSPGSSVPIPVYDSTLLAFVKEMQRTGLFDRNYVYTYSRCKIRNSQDELKIIGQTEFKEIEVIFAIMAKYVLGGMTKGVLWSEAVENGVFYYGLMKVKELLNVRDKPLA